MCYVVIQRGTQRDWGLQDENIGAFSRRRNREAKSCVEGRPDLKG
jgi:hypothetical protein